MVSPEKLAMAPVLTKKTRVALLPLTVMAPAPLIVVSALSVSNSSRLRVIVPLTERLIVSAPTAPFA